MRRDLIGDLTLAAKRTISQCNRGGAIEREQSGLPPRAAAQQTIDRHRSDFLEHSAPGKHFGLRHVDLQFAAGKQLFELARQFQPEIAAPAAQMFAAFFGLWAIGSQFGAMLRHGSLRPPRPWLRQRRL